MNRVEFIDGYVKRSGLEAHRTAGGYRIPDQKMANGRTIPGGEYIAAPCDCGEEGCQGWAMINKDDVDPRNPRSAPHGPDAS